MNGRFLVAAALVTGLATAGWAAVSRPPVIDVRPGSDVAAAIRRAPDGAVLRLLPGTHEPFEVARRVSLRALPGAEVRGPVTVSADDVRLAGLRVVGGENGVTVVGAEGVEIEGLEIRAAELHGVEISNGSAAVRGCTIAGFTGPYGQGIEVRNSNGRPRTVVEGCTVSSGQEGLVSHVSRVEFRDNVVTGTTLRGIAITEMSEGIAEGNRVTGVSGTGLYCGDMSHCEVRRNVVRSVSPNPAGGKSHSGHAAVAWYYSRMRLHGNTFEGTAAKPVGLYMSSALTDRLPMAIWPQGWAGALPGLGVVAIALAALLAVRAAVEPWSRRAGARPRPSRPWERGALLVLVGGFLVQTFHMLEHIVQVIQVYVADAEQRSGLVGARVDTEWVHFVYNVAVMGFLVWAWRQLAHLGREPQLEGARSFLLAAAVIQGYHVVEHVAKMVQHLSTGVDPAPGLLGGHVGLVWFHFGINLAVYAGLAASAVLVARSRRLLQTGPTVGHSSSTPIPASSV